MPLQSHPISASLDSLAQPGPPTTTFGSMAPPLGTFTTCLGVPAVETKNLIFSYTGGNVDHMGVFDPMHAGTSSLMGKPPGIFSPPQVLFDVNVNFPHGSRVLVVGANGSGKSTFLSIIGGKLMVPRDRCRVLAKASFHDSRLQTDRVYCGDWWSTDSHLDITVAELIGVDNLASGRVQELLGILHINPNWYIAELSDGARRRCQLLEYFSKEKSVYVLDEITRDIDIYSRDGLLRFFYAESEERNAVIFYGTHIYDELPHWATHILIFSRGHAVRWCAMENFVEYHALLAQGIANPLHTVLRNIIFSDHLAAVKPHPGLLSHHRSKGPAVQITDFKVFHDNRAYPQLDVESMTFSHGDRVLILGANGSGKSTLLSALSGKFGRATGSARILDMDVATDPKVKDLTSHCGDWWRKKYHMDMRMSTVLGPVLSKTERVRHLADVLHVSLEWRVNEISDGQERLCQLLEHLAEPHPIYLMDEATSDLDIFAREQILNFLRSECEECGATVMYGTHLLSSLEEQWATHIVFLSGGVTMKCCKLEDCAEYLALVERSDPTPLQTLYRRWINAEYEMNGACPWQVIDRALLKQDELPSVAAHNAFGIM